MMNESKDILTAEADATLSALEPDQLTASKRTPLPRRSLRLSETLMLWALRVYLVSMISILLYQVIRR